MSNLRAAFTAAITLLTASSAVLAQDQKPAVIQSTAQNAFGTKDLCVSVAEKNGSHTSIVALSRNDKTTDMVVTSYGITVVIQNEEFVVKKGDQISAVMRTPGDTNAEIPNTGLELNHALTAIVNRALGVCGAAPTKMDSDPTQVLNFRAHAYDAVHQASDFLAAAQPGTKRSFQLSALDMNR